MHKDGILRKPASKVAMEMIDIQNDDIGIKLEAIISDLSELIKNNTYKDNGYKEADALIAKLEKTIFNRFGLKVAIKDDGDLASILPFFTNKNSILLQEYLRGDFSIKEQDRVLGKSNNKKGFVNQKTAKVDGIFSEYTSPLHLNFYALIDTYKLSPSEVTAILLHELGHAFYTCEYSDRLETVNQILIEVAKEVSSKKKNKELVYVYKELKTINDKIIEKEVEDLFSENKTIASYTWFKVIIGSVETQMKNNKYTETSSEQLADNFASRFKYGRFLITALDKIHELEGSLEKNKSAVVMMNIITAINFVLMIIGAIAGILAGLVILTVYITVVAALIFLISGDNFKDYTYDELKIRYKRIRQEYINFIKDIKLDKEETESIIKNIYMIDKTMSETYINNSLLRQLSNVLISSNRNANKAIKEEQLLEDLAFNDLFLKSAELRTNS